MSKYTDRLNAQIDRLEIELAHCYDFTDALELDVDRLQAIVDSHEAAEASA